MKAFYDKIVPSAVGKLISKFGGGKMETVGLATDKTNSRVAENRIRKQTGEPLVDEALLDQPGFSITDALREKASEGLPLFQRGDGLDAFRASLSKLSAPPATDPKVIAQVQAWTDELSA